VYVGPLAGYATDPRYLGLSWPTFFFMTFIIALPGLILLAYKRPAIEALDRRTQA
jgi:MFS transporter, PAT family, beta-lactamase induction signal transducer AmpG